MKKSKTPNGWTEDQILSHQLDMENGCDLTDNEERNLGYKFLPRHHCFDQHDDLLKGISVLIDTSFVWGQNPLTVLRRFFPAFEWIHCDKILDIPAIEPEYVFDDGIEYAVLARLKGRKSAKFKIAVFEALSESCHENELFKLCQSNGYQIKLYSRV